MARTRDEFLKDCDAEDRSAYESLFQDVDDLARELGDPDPSDESTLNKPLEGVPLRLRISFGDPKGPSLRLAHGKLGGVAPLLWFFPSQNEERWTAVNRVSALLAQLPKAGVKEGDAATFGINLKKAGFVSGGGKVLKTSTAGETTGVSRVFRWESNRADHTYIPPGIVSVSYPQYPINAAAPGTVVIQVTVGRSSAIQRVKVVRDLPPFTKFALSAVNKWRFQTATLDGKSMTSNLAIAFVFSPLSPGQ